MAGGYNYVGGGQDQAVLIRDVNIIARGVASRYGLVNKQVSSRIANLLKNKYRLQVVLKISEGEYTMLKMTGQLDSMTNEINNQVSAMPNIPRLNDPLEITWENPVFGSF